VALMPVADALAAILTGAEPLAEEMVALDSGHHRVLARDVAALRTQPPQAMSAMDGYAVRAADAAHVAARLKVIGEVAAGRPFEKAVGAGEAVRIFTGGVIPEGADAVIIQEDTVVEDGGITVTEAARPGRHIRPAGIDFREGDVLLPRGTRLTDRDLSLAAGMNHPHLAVRRRPRVAMLATGDELVMPGVTPGPGQIVYSNGYAVSALVRNEGASIIDFGIAPDRLEETVAVVRRAKASGADILVTTGGASVGEHDLVQKAFAAEGMSLSFWKVALRPGRPLMHGMLGDMHVLGLPGNPVSAVVCSILFLLPLLRRLAGRADVVPQTESAVLGIDLPTNDERSDYMRATQVLRADGIAVVTPLPVQDSSMMLALAKADCLLVRAPFEPARKAGDTCCILKLPL